jgi:hypothetical protein
MVATNRPGPGNPDRFRSKTDMALLLTLACGATVEGAARQAGISPRTVARRLANPAFRRRVQEVRADMVQRAAGALTAASTESIKTLLALQQSGVPPATRLGAARAVLEIGIRLREAADLETRLAALEERLNVAGT